MKIIGWLVFSFGLLVVVASPYSFMVATDKDVLSLDAVGVLICLSGIWILLRAENKNPN